MDGATWAVGIPGTILILAWIIAVGYSIVKTIFASDSMDRVGWSIIALILVSVPVAVFGSALLTTPIY